MGSDFLVPSTTTTTISTTDYQHLQASHYINISHMSYLKGNDSVLDHSPALAIDMNDYQHYLEGKLGLKIFFCALLAFSGVIGTLGNILIILAVLTEKFLRHPGNAFIINLAIADLFVTTFIDAFNIVGAIRGHHFFDGQQWMCELIAALCAPSCAASMASICAVALNRYVRICHFHRYSAIFTWRTSILMCFGIWVYAFCVHLPNHVGWGIGDYEDSYFICTFSMYLLHSQKSSATYSYAVFYVGVAVCIPLILLTYAYIKIYRRFHQSRARVRAHSTFTTPTVPTIRTNAVEPAHFTANAEQNKNTMIVGVTVLEIPARTSKEDEEQKLTKTLFLVAAFFVGCWAPFSLFVLLGQPKFIPGWMYVISIIMAHGNSSLNWILYGITSSAFYDGYVHIVGKIWANMGAHISGRCWRPSTRHGNNKKRMSEPNTMAPTMTMTKGGRSPLQQGPVNRLPNDVHKGKMDLRAFV